MNWIRHLRLAVLSLLFGLAEFAAGAQVPAPDKTVVLTFDDAVKSHVTFVGPLLKELGLGGTFFITQAWMNDPENFLSWEDVAKLNEMGFEIGNHTWTHLGCTSAESAAKLPEELSLVEQALDRVKVAKPTSFAWPGNGFGPESLAVLKERGYRFARRGMQPELPYGEIHIGPVYEPAKYDPLLIPTTGDAYPNWTLDHFKQVVAEAKGGKIVVLQFHGVPDVAHPWVHTPPERFREYMNYLKENGFHAIALRDVAAFLPAPEYRAVDPMSVERYPKKK